MSELSYIQYGRLLALINREAPYWDDELYSTEALTDLAYRDVLLRLHPENYGGTVNGTTPTFPHATQYLKLVEIAGGLTEDDPRELVDMQIMRHGGKFMENGDPRLDSKMLEKIGQDLDALAKQQKANTKPPRAAKPKETPAVATTTNEADRLVQEWTNIFDKARSNGIDETEVSDKFAALAKEAGVNALNSDLIVSLDSYVNDRISNKDAAPAPEPVDVEVTTEVAESSATEANTEPVQSTDLDSIVVTEDGEVLDADTVRKMLGDKPDYLQFELKPDEPFTVDSLEKARWVLARIQEENIMADYYENQVKVMVNQKRNKAKGLERFYRSQLHQVTLNELNKPDNIIKSGERKGQRRKNSIVLPEGTLKLEETGGPTETDSAAFKLWILGLDQSEWPLYGFDAKPHFTPTMIKELVNDGHEIPGWVKREVDSTGSVSITKSTPRKNKKGSPKDGLDSELPDEEATE